MHVLTHKGKHMKTFSKVRLFIPRHSLSLLLHDHRASTVALSRGGSAGLGGGVESAAKLGSLGAPHGTAGGGGAALASMLLDLVFEGGDVTDAVGTVEQDGGFLFPVREQSFEGAFEGVALDDVGTPDAGPVAPSWRRPRDGRRRLGVDLLQQPPGGGRLGALAGRDLGSEVCQVDGGGVAGRDLGSEVCRVDGGGVARRSLGSEVCQLDGGGGELATSPSCGGDRGTVATSRRAGDMLFSPLLMTCKICCWAG